MGSFLKRYARWIPNRADSTARSFVQRVAPLRIVERHASDTVEDTDGGIRGSGVEAAWSEICDTVSSLRDATELSRSPMKYRAEFVVRFTRYTDDLRLIRQPTGRIDIISSSRIPGFDWCVNRLRVARIRRILRRKGLVR